MDRLTKEIELPQSKAKVTLYSFLVNGDYKKLEDLATDYIVLDYDEINVGATEKERAEIRKAQVDKCLEENEARIRQAGREMVTKLLVKSAVLEDGTTVTNLDEFIYNLSRADGKFLEEQVNKVDEESALTDEQKKN